MKKVSTMLAILAASEAMTASYYAEYRGADMLLKKKSKNNRAAKPAKKAWYTAESPEVKRMSK